ncbi:MAG: archaeosortase/exosortase family protein [Planctomycetes bacterium]|nr:archaeosortase/exosortase family protein [Planctomycetota bacterium]
MGRNSNKRRAERPGEERGSRNETGAQGTPGWILAKGPALRFVLISGGLMLLFYGVFYTSPENSPALNAFIHSYLGVYAQAGAFVLDLFGLEASAQGTTLFLGSKSVEVVRGCDAMEPIAFFVAAVIAMQVSLRSKLAGLFAGVPLLVLLNLVRILALSLVSAKLPQYFEMAHVAVGQTVFVLCTLCLWFVWALRATREVPARREAEGEARGAVSSE